MIQVPRHDYPTGYLERILRALEKNLQGEINDLEDSPEWFTMALGSALTVFNRRCSEDATADKLETWESFVTAMQVGSALFTSALATTDTVECLINHQKRTIRSGARPWAHAGNWLTAFWLACTGREERRMTELCQVPVSLMRQSGAVFDDYIYHWVEALQAYWLKRPELGNKLVAAVEGTDPDALRHTAPPAVLQLMYPPMNLLTQLVRGNQDRFNTELAQALEWHKDYWTRTEERALHSDGLIALAPMGVTGLALLTGFTIDVESDYMPQHLVNGDWVGEFAT
ncbi:immunity 49 family protein [Streptomyces sp. NBC_01537]|uniref:immunity 49 family protein n=1 Tax=Streptomyces sp. NBC_01537 TaxID=2903896 RepID=UPI00386C83FD